MHQCRDMGCEGMAWLEMILSPQGFRAGGSLMQAVQAPRRGQGPASHSAVLCGCLSENLQRRLIDSAGPMPDPYIYIHRE